MTKKKLPRSLRKFIRREKARIRREVLDSKKQKELINELYQKIFKELKSSTDSHSKNTSGNTNKAIAQNVLSVKNL